MGIFGWLRNKVRQAVLGGVSDALVEIEEADGLDALRDLLARDKTEAPVLETGNGRKQGRLTAGK